MKKHTRPSVTLVARGIITFATATALIGLAPALPAAAHDDVVSSTPAEGETITAAPEFFSVTTSEPMLDLTGEGTGFGIEVTDENGLYYGDGCVAVQDATMSSVAALGPAGDYTLTYQYVGSDGHTLSDTIGFRYEPVDSATVQGGLDSAPVCPSANDGASGDGSTPTGDTNAENESATVLAIVAAILAALAIVSAIVAGAVVMRRRRAVRDDASGDSSTHESD